MGIIISGETGIDLSNTPIQNASQVECQDKQLTPYSGFKNMLINGDFSIDQYLRGNQASWNSGSCYIDRWKVHAPTQVNLTQPSDIPPGFVNALYISKTTVQDTILSQTIEIKANKAKNTFNGRTFTFSFYVKSNVTNFIENLFFIKNGVTVNSYEVFSFKILNNTIAGEWVRVVGIITASFVYDAGDFIEIRIDPANSIAGEVYITGCQLEEGSVATPYEFRHPALEMVLCQRYYEKQSITYWSILSGTTNGGYRDWSGSFKVEKRAIPTMLFTGSGFTPSSNGVTTSSWAANYLVGEITSAKCLTGYIADAEF